jgi:hypothetical protein
METQQGNMLQSLRNVDVFLEQNADRLDGVVQSDVRQRLNEAISTLQTHVSAQADGAFGSKGATRKHQSLRRALIRDHMLPIARIAAADLPDTPEIQPLKMPANGVSVQRLAAAAYGMADTAAKYSHIFTRATLAADFAPRLTAAADAMIASIGERTKSRLVHRGATQGLATSLAAGRKIVRILDALVKSRLQEEPARLAAWQSAKRVKQPASRLTVAAPTAAPAASVAAAR